MYDCGFMKEGNWFRYRAGGIIIKDHKMLFVKSAIGGYYYMIGGAVHMGETSEACIERELFEFVKTFLKELEEALMDLIVIPLNFISI